jgi:hypothetical protein
VQPGNKNPEHFSDRVSPNIMYRRVGMSTAFRSDVNTESAEQIRRPSIQRAKVEDEV